MSSLPIYIKLLLTILVGVSSGLLFKKMRVPAGYMVGGFIGVAALNSLFAAAWVPDGTRTVVQIIAGAFVGCSMDRSDLKRLKQIVGPVIVMLVGCLIIMLLGGFLIWALSPLDLVTSLMCCVPGGINDTPIVAADMGANAPIVAILQLVRQILGVTILPSVIALFDRLQYTREQLDVQENEAVNDCARVAGTDKLTPLTIATTLTVAFCAGLFGKMTHIPGMTFTFAIIAILILKLFFNFAYIPRWMKKATQLTAGCYLGTLVTGGSLQEVPQLIVPIFIVVALYTTNCFITGGIERKWFGYKRKEAMLIASPAGASDMALIMDDMGIRNSDVVVIQVIRAVVVMALFPQIVNLISLLVER